MTATTQTSTGTPGSAPLLEIDRVAVDYPGTGFRSRPTRVLHEVSLDVRRGETVGLVGESGSGKTTLGRAVLGLVPVAAGEIRLDGRVTSTLSKKDRRELASQVQVVFQDPYTSLNPAMTVGDILAEPLATSGVGRDDARGRVRDLLDSVHLPADAAGRLPREFSGGQRQ
ncbi:MAG: transporter ATP-binding protein, partial [Marmoricola sp.]|nr:transporter ATP-binding protein [Marmoricola sp.]